jgi:arginine-tRNA-protein transferase
MDAKFAKNLLERFPAYRTSWDCLYIPDGRKTTIELQFIDEVTSRFFHIYLAHGYRRYRAFFYRNVCEGCTECVALRIEAERFAPSKSQRRTLRKNADVSWRIVHPAAATAERVALFRKYRTVKHPEDEEQDFGELLRSMTDGYAGTFEMEFLAGERVMGVSLIDAAEDALSANYFYYDTDFLPRRPGILSMIAEIDLCRRLGKRWYYPGFTLAGLSKMSYKRDFRPNEAFLDGAWVPYTE